MVLRLSWFLSRNHDVDWQQGQLLALCTPDGAAVVPMNRVDHQECPGNVPGSAAQEEVFSE